MQRMKQCEEVAASRWSCRLNILLKVLHVVCYCTRGQDIVYSALVSMRVASTGKVEVCCSHASRAAVPTGKPVSCKPWSTCAKCKHITCVQ